MLAFRPETVTMSEARDFVSAAVAMEGEFKHLRATQPIGFGWMANDLHPAGGSATPPTPPPPKAKPAPRRAPTPSSTYSATSSPSIWGGSARGRSAEIAMSGPHFEFERKLIAAGYRIVVGVDEVGRGPLAGPVGVGAVILDPDDLPKGLDDSKALTAARRVELAETIYAKAIAVSLAFASVEEIDFFNIRGATLLAMRRAVAALSIRPTMR